MAMLRVKKKQVQARTSPKGSRVGGKITKNTVTEEMVEERARELAAIAGRNPNKATDSDREDARRELLNPIHPSSDLDETGPGTAPWDPVPGTQGEKTEAVGPRDDRTTEQLVEEGVDEAEHDQMVQARKSRK